LNEQVMSANEALFADIWGSINDAICGRVARGRIDLRLDIRGCRIVKWTARESKTFAVGRGER
jgi:hypothetical protein